LVETGTDEDTLKAELEELEEEIERLEDQIMDLQTQRAGIVRRLKQPAKVGG
jgi:chorismate mutase